MTSITRDKATSSGVAPASDIPGEAQQSPLYDYGKLYAGQTPYRLCQPASVDETAHILSRCFAQGYSFRLRGSGHTFNGCTLPRGNDVLLRTRDLDWYRFEKPGTLSVGAGALVWDIRDLVRDKGLELPVYNGGWAGPSLGGYISAGGFGKGSLSDAHGGLWENINSITLLDAAGQQHVINREDDEFRWLFGSYGQFGVIVEANLKVVAEQPLAMFSYPRNETGRVPRRQTDDPADNDRVLSRQQEILFWFSLLVAPEQEEQAWEALLDFCLRHRQYLRPDGGWAGPVLDGEPIGYHYNIRFREFNPPLVYPLQQDFTVMGVMSLIDQALIAERSVILEIEKDFIQLAKSNGLRLYLQAENIGRNIDYQAYYGEHTFGQFQTLKQRYDPQGLCNSGIVFPAPAET